MIRRLHVPGIGRRKPATRPQRRLLARLARDAGLAEPPAVVWADDADRAIKLLHKHLKLRDQLQLDIDEVA